MTSCIINKLRQLREKGKWKWNFATYEGGQNIFLLFEQMKKRFKLDIQWNQP